MQRLLILLFLGVFVITASAGDEACCADARAATCNDMQSVDQGRDPHSDESPVNCDGSSCLNCVRCGGVSGLEAGTFAISFFESIAIEFAGYLSLYAPSPDIDGPFQPPKA